MAEGAGVPSVIIIYGRSVSPFVRKVMVFAAEKGIPFEVRPGGRLATEPDFARASAFGKIPAMKHGDFLLADSSAIVTYLDGLMPEPDLLGTGPRGRAQCIWFEKFADTIAYDCLYKVFYNRVVGPKFLGIQTDLSLADQAQREDFPRLAGYLEGVIPDSGFLVDDRFTLADIAVASAFATMALADCRVNEAMHPKCARYLDNVLGRASFADLLAQERDQLAAQPETPMTLIRSGNPSPGG